MTNLIRRKFAIKNTTGYSINSLIDFNADDPIEIVKHLMVGSEGTLGFVQEVTYNNVPELPFKASAFVLFPDLRVACQAASVMRSDTSVDAVELVDRSGLREVEADEEVLRMIKAISGADPLACGLLIECRGESEEALNLKIKDLKATLKKAQIPYGGKALEPLTIEDYPFRTNPKETAIFWKARKGLLPIVGAARPKGTAMLLEDITCPVDKLGDMVIDLMEVFKKWGYDDASAFGHALEGNMHVVFSQSFKNEEDIKQYEGFMTDFADVVANKYGGSLKGEHGTGRNIAPFVE